jgi:multidrug resistance efflux pump
MAVVIALLISFWGCKDQAKVSKFSEGVMILEWSKNGTGNHAKLIEVEVKIEMLEEQIMTEISGVIEKVFVQIGDTVHANEPLAKYDDQHLKSDMNRINEMLTKLKDNQIKSSELYAKKLISRDEFNKQNIKYNQLRTSFKESKEKLEKSIIYASTDGVVKTTGVCANIPVKENSPAFILIRLDSADVNFVLNATMEEKFTVGDTLILKEVADDKNTFDGRLISITSSNQNKLKVNNLVIRVKR